MLTMLAVPISPLMSLISWVSLLDSLRSLPSFSTSGWHWTSTSLHIRQDSVWGDGIGSSKRQAWLGLRSATWDATICNPPQVEATKCDLVMVTWGHRTIPRYESWVAQQCQRVMSWNRHPPQRRAEITHPYWNRIHVGVSAQRLTLFCSRGSLGHDAGTWAFQLALPWRSAK